MACWPREAPLDTTDPDTTRVREPTGEGIRIPLTEVNVTQFAQSALDALSIIIAILDEEGTIVSVNASWRRFADDNGLTWPGYGVGRNYLSGSVPAEPHSTEGALEAAEGLGRLLAGQRDQFSVEYACHSPSQKRWFVMRASRFASNGRLWVIVAHEDITAQRLAQESLRAARESAEAARYGGELRQQVAEARSTVAVEALHQAELRYRTVADFTYDWEYWENPDGSLRYVSPSCERITGYPAEQFLKRPGLLSELVVAEDRPIWSEHQHTRAEANSRMIQFRIERRDGAVRWIEHACQPVVGERGRFLGYRASNRDITERKRVERELERHRERLEELVAERTAELAKANEDLRTEMAEREQAEEALRRSEERYALAQRAAHVGSWDWDIQGGVVHWSDQIEPLFGLRSGEFGGTYEAFLESVHPEDRQYVVDSIDACVEGGQDYAIEHRIVWPDGTIRWLAETGDVLRDEGGRATRMLGIVKDITERKREEAARYRLAAIVESSDDAIIGKSLDGTIQSWNAGAERIYGYPASEVLGRSISILLPPDRPDEVAQLLKRLDQGERVEHFETQRVRQDGRTIHVSLNVSPIVDETGRMIGASTIARNISRRKRAERALREAKEAAETARYEEELRRQEAEQRRQIAESLGDVLTVLNSNRSLDEVLDYIAVQAGQLLGTRAAGIYSLEPESGVLAVRAARGLLLTYVGGADVPIGQEALRQAMAFRQPVAVSDLVNTIAEDGDRTPDEGWLATARVWTRLYRGLMAVPIVVQNELYGGMLLYYAEPRTFAGEEIELAVTFSEQVALAIGNARLREQVQQAAAIAERDRLARDLHDSVTQTLFSASLIAEAMPRVWQQDPEGGRRGLEELRSLTQGAAAEMRTLLLELRPAALTEKPLGELLRHLTAAMTNRTRVPIALTVEGDSSLAPDIQIALYRITQEALNNVAKHAGADEVSVSLRRRPDRVRLQIRDNGCGFEPDDILPDRLGVRIMHERAKGIGADLTMDSRPGHGTQLVVRWQETRGETVDD